jgi:vitamin K-dependent gamma-carboxylase-like protein
MDSFHRPHEKRLGHRISRFFGAPASAKPLAVFRIGIAFILLVHACVTAGNSHYFYEPLGIVQEPLANELVHPSLPSLNFFLDALSRLGISQSLGFRIVFMAYVLALNGLLWGWHTRIAALVSWLLFLTLKTAGNAGAYGVFEFAHIALFYCVVMPVGHFWSLDQRQRLSNPTASSRLALRVLQMHLCIVYLASGLEKASGIQWWNGEAMWRAVMRPSGPFDFSWLASFPLIATVAGLLTLIIETGYAFLIWPQRTRHLWILLTVGMHVGIAIMLGLYFFSAVMIVFTVSAFGISAEPLAIQRKNSGEKAVFQPT